MSSNNAGDEDLDLDRGLRVTPEDVEALRRNRPGPKTFEEYVAFLASFPPPSRERLLSKPGPRGARFRLPDDPGE